MNYSRKIIIVALLASCFLLACNSRKYLSHKNGNSAGWVVGDFHEHSLFSDGGMKLDSVFDYATKHFGVNFMVNTDHGGAYPRNWDGSYWSSYPELKIEGSDAGKDEKGRPLMWRWQELRDFSFAKVDSFRTKYPSRHYIQGLEWNSPATSHTSTGIIADSGLPIAMFEYQFDSSDKDTLGGPAKGLVKQNGRKNGNGDFLSHAERTAATAGAVKWLMKNHRYSSWTILAHPERSNNVKIEDIRNINNAGPDVAFGFEGIPGHQKLSIRSSFHPENALGGGTYGGVGYMSAKTGGVWDALLGEGRHFWLFTSSDFHGTSGDFWPGEYHKTWIYSKDTTSAVSILEGMRAGNVFVTNGDLITKLDFNVSSKKGKNATMGQTLQASRGEDLEIKIRFKTPVKNHNGESPQVKTIQLIMGDVKGKVDPRSPDYKKDVNESTKIIKLFTSQDWIDKDGWKEISFKIEKPLKDVYFRIRGTNHAINTPYETDKLGNPLLDTLAIHLNLDGPEEAWTDLWFYSNPIFVKIK